MSFWRRPGILRNLIAIDLAKLLFLDWGFFLQTRLNFVSFFHRTDSVCDFKLNKIRQLCNKRSSQLLSGTCVERKMILMLSIGAYPAT